MRKSEFEERGSRPRRTRRTSHISQKTSCRPRRTNGPAGQGSGKHFFLFFRMKLCRNSMNHEKSSEKLRRRRKYLSLDDLQCPYMTICYKKAYEEGSDKARCAPLILRITSPRRRRDLARRQHCSEGPARSKQVSRCKLLVQASAKLQTLLP